MTIGAHKRYTTYPAKFDNLVLPDIVSVAPSAAIQKALLTPGGALSPALVAEVQQDPVVSLTVMDLKTILAQCGFQSALAISSAAVIQYQQRALGGTFAGNGNHVRLTAPAGLLYLDSVRATQDEASAAAVNCRFQSLGNTTTRPFTVAIGQNLLGTPSIPRAYKLGPVVFEGDVLGGVQSSSVQSGLTCATKRGDGRTWAVTGSITKAAPSAEVMLDTLDLADDVGFGSAAISSGISIYFQQIGAAAGDLAHIRFTFNAGLYEISEMPASGEGDASAKLTVTGARDGAALVTVTSDVALP